MTHYKLLAFIAIPCFLASNPKGEQIVQGNVALQTSGQALHITASDGAIIQWKDFSIDANQTTKFIQPSTKSVVTNKVIEANPSKILGRLEANGKVFLINPAGILVGKEGSVRAGAFIASTMEITSLKDGSLHAEGDSKAAVINLGSIKTLDGDALLIGHVLENHGTIEAENGTAGALGFHDVLIKPEGSNRFLIQVSEDRLADQDIQSPYALAFSHPTNEDALSFLEGQSSRSESDFINTGTLSSRTSEQKGGQILALADNIFCREGTLFDVSGAYGAGEVLIGGDYKAQNTDIPIAQRLFFLKNANINANAIEAGNSGKVILWSEQVTYVEGNIEARGGAIQGDGGFIEISGKKGLHPEGTVQTMSPNGKSGTLLLDPVDVTISAAVDANVTNPNGLVGAACGGPGVYIPPNYTFLANPVNINAVNLQNILQSCGNVIIDSSAPGAGTGAILVDGTATVTWTSANSLTLLSPTTITVLAGGDITCTGTGNITLTAANDITILANIYNGSVAVAGGTVAVTSTNGNILIGNAAMLRSVKVGSHRGTTNVSALGPASDILLTGGTVSGFNNWAIIGEENGPVLFDPAIGDINVQCTRDLILQGGTNTLTNVCSALIGKIVAQQTNGRIDSGNINIDVGRDLKLLASAFPSFYGDAMIGHSTVDNPGAPSKIFSDININVGRNLEMFGGVNAGVSGCNAVIGAFSWVTGLGCRQKITINVGENLWMHSQGISFTVIGGGVEKLSDMYQSLYLNVGANLTLDGFNGPNAIQPFNYTGIAPFNGAPNFYPTGFPPDMFIHVGGDFVLRAGNTGFFPVAYCQQDHRKNTQVWVGGNIRCYNGLAGNALFHSAPGAALGFFNSSVDIGDFDARAGGDILVGGGVSGLFAPTAFRDLIFNTKPINQTSIGPAACRYEADHAFVPSELWPTQSAIIPATAGAFNIFTTPVLTPLGAVSGNTSTTAPFHSGGDGLGAIAYNTYRYDTSATPSTVNGFPLIAPVPVGPFTPPTNNRLSYQATGNISMLTSHQFDNGTPADGSFGNNPAQARLRSTGGDVTISSFRNTLLQFLRADLGSILVITENNLTVDGFIQANNTVDLVCDNQFPVSPLIGPGSYTMTGASSIISGAFGFGNPAGYLRVYTARQAQNTINPAALFNGLTFTPGLLFVNTNQEVWCTYYPNGINGIPFTIFYKDCFPVPPITQANLIVSQFITDQFMEWPINWPALFRIFYDRTDVASLNWKEEFSGNALLSNEKYWEARRKIKKIHEPRVNRDWDL